MTDDSGPARHFPTDMPPARPAAAPTTDGLAVAAMVIGIVALLACWVPFLNIVLAVLAIVFGIVGVVRGISRGMAIAGIVLGGISLLIVILFFIGVIIAVITGVENLPRVTVGQ